MSEQDREVRVAKFSASTGSRSSSEPESSVNPRGRKPLLIAVIALAVVFVVLSGFLVWKSYIAPQQNAVRALEGIAASRGNITALNTSMVTYNGQKVAEANVKQKGLGQGDRLTSPPAFIFTNGKKDDSRKVVDFYFDFSDQRSRDALISNSNSLRDLVESGKVELRLHSLLSGRAYSVYASEALAEVFSADSDHSWDSLLVLLRNAPEYADSDSNDEIVKGIVSSVKNTGANSVDAESVKNGTFASWLLSVGNDPKLNGAVAPKLPYILVADRELNLSVNQLNDSDAFKRAVLKEIG